MYYQSHFLLG